LIAPDGHVRSNVPGITGAAVVSLISPAMGARFAQLLVTFEAGGRVAMDASEVETVGYFEKGGGVVTVGREKEKLGAGGFFFAPAGEAWSIKGPKGGTRLTLFQKKVSAAGGGGGAEGDFLAMRRRWRGSRFWGIRMRGCRCCCRMCRSWIWR